MRGAFGESLTGPLCCAQVDLVFIAIHVDYAQLAELIQVNYIDPKLTKTGTFSHKSLLY
jgi:hypothetical protein